MQVNQFKQYQKKDAHTRLQDTQSYANYLQMNALGSLEGYEVLATTGDDNGS